MNISAFFYFTFFFSFDQFSFSCVDKDVVFLDLVMNQERKRIYITNFKVIENKFTFLFVSYLCNRIIVLCSVRDSKISFSQNPLIVSEKEPLSAGEQDVLNCCPECTSNYEKEVGSNSQQKSSLPSNSCNNKNTENDSPQLPYWLKPHGNDTPKKVVINYFSTNSLLRL